MAGFSGDGGPASQPQLNHPTSVCLSPQGDVYVNDLAKLSHSQDLPWRNDHHGGGQRSASELGRRGASYGGQYEPTLAGNIYIADHGAARVRKVNTSGTISTFAGNGSQSFSGDGGLATAASLNDPTALAVDPAGNVYITDQSNQRIRKVDTSGNITTIAGNGSIGFSGDGGSAIQATFNYPGSIAFDSAGALYVVDCNNNRLRKISEGVISTIAGTGAAGFGGDGGPALQAILNGLFALALDGNVNVYLGDFTNNRVRVIKASGVTAITEVDNGFSNSTNSPIQAGSWVVVKGTNLSSTHGRGWNAILNFPTSMDGTSVTVNGKPAFLYFISPTQVNFQAPTYTATGPVQVVVTNNGAISAPATAQLQPFSLALLQWGGGQYPMPRSRAIRTTHTWESGRGAGDRRS